MKKGRQQTGMKQNTISFGKSSINNKRINPGNFLSHFYWIQIRHHEFGPSYSDYIIMIQGVCNVWKEGQILYFVSKDCRAWPY